MAAPAGFSEFFVAWIGTQADLAGLLGSPGELRVSPQQAHRKSGTPRIEFFQVSGRRIRGVSGPHGVNRERWQMNVWGDKSIGAREVARLITGNPVQGDPRLDGFTGTLAGVTVQMCVLLDEGQIFVPLTPGDDLGTPGIRLDFDFAYVTV
jgi:hypothetical protein